MLRIDRLFRLTSRTLCLAAVPIVIFAFWDAAFYPLVIKEILIQATAVLALLCWWVSGGASRGASLPNPLSRPLFYLCLFALLSILWSPAKQIALAHWVAFASLLLFMPPLLDFGKAPHFRTTYRNMILSVAMILLLLSAFQINGYSLDGLMRVGGGNARQRISLTVGHNNGVAPFILVASFLAMAAFTRIRSWMVRLSLAGFVVTCWALIVFFLLTRSTMIGLVFGGALLVGTNLWALWARRGKTVTSRGSFVLKWTLALSLVFLIGLIVVGGFTASRGGAIQGEYNPNLARNIADRLRTLNPDFLWRDTRARLWAISFHMMRHHPLLGVGFSAAKIDYPFYQASFFEYFPDFPAGPTINHTEGMHNDYLQWAVECGAVGLVLLMWLLMVLIKITLAWLRGIRHKAVPVRFAESATIIACVVLMMDALFSFPAHIAPLAVCIPGMVMLWLGCIYGNKTQSTSSPIFQVSLPIWGRLGIAAAVWAVLALPLAPGKDHNPLVCRTGLWSPLTAQVVGNAWHTQLVANRGFFQNRFNTLRGQIHAGTLTDPKELETTLESIHYFQSRCEQVAKLIPFAGDAIYDLGSGLYDAFQFMSTTRPAVSDRYVATGRFPETVLRGYNRTGEVLTGTANLFQQCLQNYRYHSLYWYLGLVKLDRAKMPGTDPETRESLIESGLENLTIARRIFSTPERILAEILANLSAGEEEGASERIPILLAKDPGLITQRVIPEAMRNKLMKTEETGDISLDPNMTSLCKVMLPHLDARNGGILQDSLALLERGGEASLAEAYLKKKTGIFKQPLGVPYWSFRIEDQMKTAEDFTRFMAEYQTILAERPRLPFADRALFLSDLQRFAPAGVDMSAWREAVLELYQNMPGRLAGILSMHMLAQESLSRGGYQEAWRWNLEAQANTTTAGYPNVTDRRPGVIDASLWGLTWPVMIN